MKAIVCPKYGPPEVLRYEEVPKPVPKEGELLVKVHSASVNAADWHLLTADIFLVRLMTGLFKPRNAILGADFAGTVEAVGSGVRRFRPGDAVFGDAFDAGSGSFAEYVCVAEASAALKPANVSFDQAAASPLAAVTALQGLRDQGKIGQGKRVLIQGASGGVGSFAVQIAKHFGAEVTAVCSPANMDVARSLGADHLIDYTREDFTRNGKRYDLILAANGFHPISAYRRSLSPQGIYVMAGGRPAQMFQALLLGPWMSKKKGRQLGALSMKQNQADLEFLRLLLESGQVRPVIDKKFPLQKVPEALGYLGTGHAKGKIVIEVIDHSRVSASTKE